MGHCESTGLKCDKGHRWGRDSQGTTSFPRSSPSSWGREGEDPGNEVGQGKLHRDLQGRSDRRKTADTNIEELFASEIRRGEGVDLFWFSREGSNMLVVHNINKSQQVILQWMTVDSR